MIHDLVQVYLASEHKVVQNGPPANFAQPHQSLLQRHPLSQSSLAPALLKVYGDVENIGQDKITVRFEIACVLKFLWDAGTEHRGTFRRLAADQESFLRFANGIMNETNSLVATIMEKLGEIRAVQQQQQKADEWGALSDEDRSNHLSRLAENEQQVSSCLLLANETIHMLAYLTSDSDIKTPFLRPELLPRLATMLLAVLAKLVGSKGFV